MSRRDRRLRKSTAFRLKHEVLRLAVEEICRNLGISDATFCNRKQEHTGLKPSELRP
jgi:putative transposase